MYERFTDRARKVMQMASRYARSKRANVIEPPHVLYSLIDEGGGVAANIIRMAVSCRLSFDVLSQAIDLQVPIDTTPALVRGDSPGRLPNSPATNQLVEAAISWSRQLDCNYVGTEHILLACFDSNMPPEIKEVLTLRGITSDFVVREWKCLTTPRERTPEDVDADYQFTKDVNTILQGLPQKGSNVAELSMRLRTDEAYRKGWIANLAAVFEELNLPPDAATLGAKRILARCFYYAMGFTPAEQAALAHIESQKNAASFSKNYRESRSKIFAKHYGEEKTPRFAVGSQVRRGLSGPLMRVVGVAGDIYHCSWQDDQGKPYTESFSEASLIQVVTIPTMWRDPNPPVPPAGVPLTLGVPFTLDADTLRKNLGNTWMWDEEKRAWTVVYPETPPLTSADVVNVPAIPETPDDVCCVCRQPTGMACPKCPGIVALCARCTCPHAHA